MAILYVSTDCIGLSLSLFFFVDFTVYPKEESLHNIIRRGDFSASAAATAIAISQSDFRFMLVLLWMWTYVRLHFHSG